MTCIGQCIHILSKLFETEMKVYERKKILSTELQTNGHLRLEKLNNGLIHLLKTLNCHTVCVCVY